MAQRGKRKKVSSKGAGSGKGTSMQPLHAAPPPAFIAPCLAKSYQRFAGGDAWIHEIKFDGYRIQARLEHGAIQLLTRTGLDWTARFGAIKQAFAKWQVASAVLDGEVVVEETSGLSSFTALVEALKAGRSDGVVYYAFDLLFLNGLDLQVLPLSERRAALETLLSEQPEGANIRFSQHLEGNGEAIFTEACKLGLEGIVSKRKDKPYRSGRRDEWRKIKCAFTDEFVIGGYADHAAQKSAIGSLALGYFKNGKFIYTGRVGTGFDQRTAAALWEGLQALRAARSPFHGRLTSAQRSGMTWVKPKVVVNVAYRGWSADGLLRQAAYKGVRDDKPAEDVGPPAGGPNQE